VIYRWLVFLHVLSVFGFLMAHGISVGAAFALRRERNLERIQALLNLSGNTIGALHGSILLLLISGVANGFIGNWWRQGWIWVSLGLLLAIYIYMGVAASGYYGRVRKAVGMSYMEGYKPKPPVEPASEAAIDALLRQSRPLALAVAGFGGLAVITWLMEFKPF